MTIGEINGNTFDNLQLYAEFTGNEGDDQAMEKLNQQILAAVPGATGEQVGAKIDEIKLQNPNWTMDQVFEAAVKDLNPGCTDAQVSEIRSAWQEFTGVSNLTQDNIGDILANPLDFVLDNPEISETSVKNLIAIFMLLMIEIAGEESAGQLLEGCMQRDEIEIIAKEKASEMRTKALWSAGTQALGGLIQMGSSAAALSSSAKGFKAANKAADMGSGLKGDALLQQNRLAGQANSYAANSQAIGQMGGGASSLCNAVGTYMAGVSDAKIAVLDGQSQAASINKDTADKLRQKGSELIQACLQLLQSMAQADYQTMSAIGRA